MNIQDFLFGYAVNTVLQIVAFTIKNPASKAKYFAALRKIVTAILTAYPALMDDPAVVAISAKRAVAKKK